jgi:hypothetical protein
MSRWTFKIKKELFFDSNVPWKFLSKPLLTLTNSHFHWVVTYVDDSRLLFCTCRPSTVVRVALDVRVSCQVQVFQHTNTGGFLLWALESGQCDTGHLPIISRASLATAGDREEQPIQPIGIEEKVKNRFGLVRGQG